MSKTYDPECYNLACYFLDECKGVTEKKREELARRIQQTVDDYGEELMNEDDDGVDEQIWIPGGGSYTTDKRRPISKAEQQMYGCEG